MDRKTVTVLDEGEAMETRMLFHGGPLRKNVNTVVKLRKHIITNR